MKSPWDAQRKKKWLPPLTYSAFCWAPRDRTTWFLGLIAGLKNSNSLCPVKQTRALLESNPPRDSWTDGDEIKNVSTFGEAATSPKTTLETFISEPEHAFQNSSKTFSKSSKSFSGWTTSTKYRTQNYLSSYPFFRSKRTSVYGLLMA